MNGMRLKELQERLGESEKWRKLRSDARTIAKPALITTVIVAGVVGVVFLMLVVSREEDVSDFLKRWEEIVESGNDQAYEEICSKEFKEEFRDSYEDIKNLITGQEIAVDIEDEDIQKIALGDNRYVIKHIPMVLPRNGIKTHEKLEIKQKGLVSRRWEIALEERHFSKAAQEELEQIVEGKPADLGSPSARKEETPLDTDFRVRQTLEVWRTAWNNKDLDGYIDCYADYADITRVTVVGGKEKQAKLTKSKLRKHMARLSKKYSKIQVDITNLEIEGDTAIAKANFLQEYTSWDHPSKEPVYRDLGTKELQFVKHDVEWKIANENWTLYRDVPVYPKQEY